MGYTYWCDNELCRENESGCNPSAYDEVRGYAYCEQCGGVIGFMDTQDQFNAIADLLESQHDAIQELTERVAQMEASKC